MPQYFTDPSITSRGLQNPPSLLDTYVRLMQLQQMKIGREEANLRLAELRRAAKEGAAIRSAYGAGVSPGFNVPATPGRPGIVMPTQINRERILQELARGGETAYLVPEVQQQFATQDYTQEQERVKLADQLQKLDKGQLDNLSTRIGMIGSMAMSVLQAPPEIRPRVYAGVKSQAEQLGLIQPGQAPEQYGPEIEPLLEQQVTQAMSVKDVIDTENRRRELAIREKPKLGEEAPLPPAVEAQKKRIAEAGKASREPNEREQWIKEHPGASTDDYLRFKAGLSQENLTTTTRTMIEAAPKVRWFVDQIKAQIPSVKAQLGPAAGRWSEFWAGKLGATRPEYVKLRANIGLLQTLLMRMHVGARGGVEIMTHFKDLFDQGKFSAENMDAALDAVGAYADEVASMAKRPNFAPIYGPNSGGQAQPTAGPKVALKVGDRKTFPNGNVAEWDGTGWVLIQQAK
jgi:hypothetical protein